MQPLVLMMSGSLIRQYRNQLDQVIGRPWRYVDPEEELADTSGIEIALFSRSIYAGSNRQQASPQTRRFFDALAQSPRLAWLHVFSSGSDNPLYRPILQRGVCVSTSTGAAGKTVALTAFTGLLALSRGMPRWIQAKQQRVWAPVHGKDAPAVLAKQTAVVVGTGVIGCEFARLSGVVGLQCIGVRRGLGHIEPFQSCIPVARLDEVLPRADWLVLACPLTKETHGLIDARRLRLLPRTAQVINVARGGVLVERDLVSALQQQTIAGAYLDVFETEPLPTTSAFWEMPQVLLSPHNAAISQGYDDQVMRIFLANLACFLSGKPLTNLVDVNTALGIDAQAYSS